MVYNESLAYEKKKWYLILNLNLKKYPILLNFNN